MEVTIERAMQLGVESLQSGRLPEAERFFCEVLVREPNHADALHLLGLVAHQEGRLDDAIELTRQAIARFPGSAIYHNNLGIALRERGLSDEAIAAHRRATKLKPDFAVAHGNLGIALQGKGMLDEAAAAHREAIRVAPGFADAYFDLGNVLREKGELDEAIAVYRQGILLKPHSAEAHNELGSLLRNKGLADEAMGVYQEALRLKGDFAEARGNLGLVLGQKGEIDQAIESQRQAIRLNPELADAHHNLSHALLLNGEFEDGWKEYEWRFRSKGFVGREGFLQPRWDGGDVKGKTMLLYTEQGFGDTILYARFAPKVAERGCEVILQCQAELVRVLKSNRDMGRIIAVGEEAPRFDVQCSVVSLPFIFGTTLESIPASIPYLRADPGLVDLWKEKLGPAEGKLRVGLAWAGNPRFKADGPRSLRLEQLAPLGAVRGAQFYSLQKGPAGEQAGRPPAGLELVDVGRELNDFADTAAVMSLMDLIVSTDTSVAHLAGAMGRPAWVMLQRIPYFIWLLDREESPWYPTARLFRQKSPGAWGEVIERVAESLQKLCAEREAG